MSTPMQPHGGDVTDADLPDEWPQEVRDAFWSAVNAPTYTESQRLTLVFAEALNNFHGPAKGDA